MDKLRRLAYDKLICCLILFFTINAWWHIVFNMSVDYLSKIDISLIVLFLSLWIVYLFTKDLFNGDSELLSQMTQEEFKTLLEKTIRDTAKIKSGIANVAATKNFVTENVEELKKEISKALKDNASDSMKIKLIDNLVRKKDKCPILFTNGTFMSCLKAILELDKNKEK